jgi:hypothetical protein
MEHAHSGLRWLVLVLLLVAIVKSFTKKNKNDFHKGDRLVYLFTMISIHVQITIGIVLYFISSKVYFIEGWMKNPQLRFYGLEHVLMMIIAAIIVTIGHKKSKSALEPNKKHKAISVFYTLTLLLILVAIPWPFRNLGGKWF